MIASQGKDIVQYIIFFNTKLMIAENSHVIIALNR
jgi:hypothetical protein